jgi:hypothetical protein
MGTEAYLIGIHCGRCGLLRHRDTFTTSPHSRTQKTRVAFCVAILMTVARRAQQSSRD